MPLLELTGPQRRQLRQLLLGAFPSWNELRRLIADQLDVNLAEITSQAAPLEDNVFDVIAWTTSRGRLAELILGARNQNPGHLPLQDFAARLGLSAAGVPQASVLEKIVSGNTTFLDVAKWRAELTRCEWRVCRVDCDGEGVGTGFLVGADLVLTNYHVVEELLEDAAQAPRWSCRFDYKLAATGDVISMGTVVKLAADWLVDAAPYSAVDMVADPKPGDPTAEELDYALLRLAQPLGELAVGKGEEAGPRGWIALSADAVDFAAHRMIAILQHPKTQPLKLALGMEETLHLAGANRRLRYKLPTEPGSSGSPVFTRDWKLVALHHSGDPRIAQPEYNEAIPIALIAARPKVAAALA